MDDSKNKNPNDVPEGGTQPTAEEVSATVTDGSEAAVAEAIGEAERAAKLEEMINREFQTSEGNSAPEGAENAADHANISEADQSEAENRAPAENSGTGLPTAADKTFSESPPVPAVGSAVMPGSETLPVTRSVSQNNAGPGMTEPAQTASPGRGCGINLERSLPCWLPLSVILLSK